MKSNSAQEISEKEVQYFLEKYFGAKDIELNPKVGDKKADFRIKSIDTYVEVHALKNILSDLIDIYSEEKLTFGALKQWKLKDNGQRKRMDRIASKLLHECTQLPQGKKNLIVTKTEELSLFPEYVIDTIIGEPHWLINIENNQTTVEHGVTGFRTREELLEVLQKISAFLAYKRICQHGKMIGILGNNKNTATFPFNDKILSVFQSFLCSKCM